MEMVENHNLKTHEQPGQDSSGSWSELPFDLLSSVFERLGFADFQRGKSVCSSWNSALQSMHKDNTTPWLILFPEQNKNNFCMLFNPEEKHKLYKTQDLGLDFGKSDCVSTYGNWLLMRDHRDDLYILNLFTHERINLPPVKSHRGPVKIERDSTNWFNIKFDNGACDTRVIMQSSSPVLWIDEKTKNYVVLWKLNCLQEALVVVYSKNGDTYWNQIPNTSDCHDMVYKDYKLYYLSYKFSLGIIDFSEETPRQTTHQCHDLNHYCEHGLLYSMFTQVVVVVTVTGDILKVQKRLSPECTTWSFRIFKVYSQGTFQKCEQLYSLGDEAMLLDFGITVIVSDLKEGFKRNSIYFNSGDKNNPNEIFIFDLETQKLEQLHKFECSSVRLSTSQWFLPSYK